MMTPTRMCVAAAALVAAFGDASAQFDQRWVELQANQNLLTAGTVSSNSIMVSFESGDLDLDGDLDLVVPRRAAYFSTTPQTNLLLMNEPGGLVDRTAQYAWQSTVAGDQGFLSPTFDHAAVVVDVDQDGWPDVVTAPGEGVGLPKFQSHPRVYRNLAAAGGTWSGLRYEEPRIPTLLHLVTGMPGVPRFTEVAAGDVTGDGFPDLYFVDHDGLTTAEPQTEDLNDRLLVNNGSGFFTDQSATAMTSTMLLSRTGTDTSVDDLNGDGVLDVLKVTSSSPQYVSVAYNNATTTGTFAAFTTIESSSTYFAEVGDLNNDGRLDVVLGDDLADRIRYNLGNAPSGFAMFGSAVPFKFLTGADDGLSGQVRIADLDGDGWPDVLIADMDFSFPGTFRRLHVYHNPGGAAGAQVVLVEERESASDLGWIGAVGLTKASMNGTFDVATLDVDGDQDLDLVVGRVAGTTVYENRRFLCQPDIGFGGPGATTLSVCGEPLALGKLATLRLAGATPFAPAMLIAGLSAASAPFYGGTLVPVPPALTLLFATDAAGDLAFLVPGGFGPLSVFVQMASMDTSLPFGVAISNAVRIDLLP